MVIENKTRLLSNIAKPWELLYLIIVIIKVYLFQATVVCVLSS